MDLYVISPVCTSCLDFLIISERLSQYSEYLSGLDTVVPQNPYQEYTMYLQYPGICTARGQFISFDYCFDAFFNSIQTQTHEGRTSEDEITVYKSLGVGIQDIISAQFVLEEAEKHDLGLVVDF